MTTNRKNILKTCVAGVLFVASSASMAFTIGTTPVAPVGNPSIFSSIQTVGITGADIGQSFNMSWFLDKAYTGGVYDLSAASTWMVTGFTSSQLDLTVSVTNNTNAAFQEAILALGFGTDPNTTATITAGAVFDNVSAGSGPQQNFPGGFKNIDACVFSAGCSGGNVNTGLQSGGNSDTFSLSLAGAFGATPAITLDTFAIKFQGEAGSFEFPSTPDGTTPPQQVPVPATMLLLGLGAFGFAARRKAA